MPQRLIPVHPAQKDILVDQLIAPGKPFYNVGAFVKLKGSLNVPLFKHALNRVAGKTDLLRMRFDSNSETLRTYFDKPETVPLCADADFSEEQEPATTALSWMQERMNTPFEVDNASGLFEHYVLKISAQEYWYYLRAHHALFDGYCYGIWMKHVNSAYRTLLQGNEEAEVVHSFEKAVLEANNPQGMAAQTAHAKYWEQRIPAKPLPLLQKRKSVAAEKESDFYNWYPDEALQQTLETIAEKLGIRLPHLLAGAVMIYFGKTLQRETITVGTPAHKRKPGIEREIPGMFSGILAFQGQYRPDVSLREMLLEIAALQKKDAAHAAYPLGELAARFKHSRLEGPLLDVIVNYLSMKLDLDFGDQLHAAFTPLISDYQAEPLRIMWFDHGDGTVLRFDFRKEYFDKEEIILFAGRVVYILQQFSASLEKTVDSIDIIPPAEINLLKGFSGSSAVYPSEKTIVQLFDAQVQRSPEAVAMAAGSEQFTYAALDAAGSRLANYLLKTGITAHTIVPVCLERSPELIIALLAILKAGGIYLPLDPGYPAARINAMLENTAARIVISNSSCRDHLPEGITVIDLDSLEAILEWLPEEINDPGISASAPAYIMYTSGSTGKPKGVTVSHRNVTSLATGGGFVTFDHTDLLLATGSPSFDASTIEYWGTLLNGGQLVLCDESALLDPARLKREITDRKITKMWFTASWLNQLVDNDIDLFGSLKTVMAGGEKLSEKHIALLLRTFPHLEVVNGYGPTENTTFSLTYTIPPGNLYGSIPIGRPLLNRTAFILDPHQQPVPVGVVGELYVGGDGLSNGYHQQPELTAEKFIWLDGHRLYRTGDLAYWQADGNAVYAGRMDEQVKIRGHRIEPGEIEQVLLRSGYIRQVVVIAKAGTDGVKRLLAYIVLLPGYDIVAIRAFAEKHLPEYMVPSSWTTLISLPLTANGKTDKAALPDPDNTGGSNVIYEAPRNTIEQQLADIWKEILQVQRVSIHDNFFHLGGDSIIAIGVTSRLRKTFHKEIKLFDLYQTPTIAGLAQTIAATAAAPAQTGDEKQKVLQSFETLRQNILAQLPDATQIEDVFPMSDIQGGMVAASLLDPELAIYHDQLAYTMPADLNIPAFEKAFSLLVQQHAVLRTAFDLELHPGGVQIVYRSIPVTLARPVLKKKDARTTKADIDAYLQEERKQPFHVRQAPLWRAAVIDAADSKVFVLQFHHALADGWSVASFNTALNNLYLRICAGEQVNVLPPLKSSYKDYVVEMMMEKQQHAIGHFWKNEMDEYKRLDIFTDQDHEQRLTKAYDRHYLSQLKTKAAAENISMKTVFLGTYLYTLSMLTAERELTIGVVTNNRPLIEDSDKIFGCFLNSIPFRHQTAVTRDTWKAWFEQVEQHLNRIKEYDRSSLADIRKATGEGFSNENAFFDVLFNFVNFHVYDQLEEGPYSADIAAMQQEDKLDTGFESVNTYLNCIASITKDVLVIIFLSRKTLQSGITLEEFQLYFDTVLDQFLYQYEAPINRHAILQAVPARFPAQPTGEVLPYPSTLTVTAIFSQKAKETPAAMALSCGKLSLSYEELDVRSNQLAHYLKNAGVTTGGHVAICLDRSAELLIAILGTLKAGAVYVPVDPRYPAERIAYMLDDIAAPVTISNSEYRDLFAEDATVLNLDVTAAMLEWMPADALDAGTGPDSPAYIMYTSGSTGRPKGVIVTHRNISSLVTGSGCLPFSSNDCLLATGSPSFDATTLEYWGMLLNGGHLIINTEAQLLDIALLKKEIQTRQVTKMFFTTSWLNQLIDHDLSVFAAIQAVMTGGEKISERHIEKLKATHPALTIINCYGPTENATVSLAYTINIQTIPTAVPIGCPLANRQAYILDAWLQPLPAGVPGELCVGGDGLAAGYLNREDLTDKYFITGPDGHRLYRTGDKACWLQDGNAVYLGRLDQQIKIRGHRIEPGEIEQVIMDSGMADQAVVIPHKDQGETYRLIAYIVPAAGYSSTALQHRLEKQLPDYMLPAHTVELSVMPLNTNGKIDKAALPAYTTTLNTTPQDEEAASHTEQKLMEIWQQVLHLEKIGRRDDFFRHGGDSIVAIGAINSMRREIDDRIRLFDLYQHSTIAAMAAAFDKLPPLAHDTVPQTTAIEAALRALKDRLLPILPDSDNIADLFPMSDIQRGMIYTSLLEPEQAIYHDQFIYPFPLEFNFPAFQLAVAGMVEKHGILRTAFNMDDAEEGIQIVYNSVPVNIDFIDQSSLDDAAGKKFIHRYLAAERKRPIDTRRGPLWRMTVLQLERRHVLLLQFHHAMLDGWSLASFTRELNNRYVDYIRGTELSRQPDQLKCTYKDAVIQALLYKTMTAQQAFWKNELTDYKRLTLFSEEDHYDRLVYPYEQPVWEQIKERCNRDGISHKALFLGVSLCVMGILTHEDEITMGLVTNNRPIIEDGENVLGCFLNTIPVRHKKNNQITWTALFRSIDDHLKKLKEWERTSLLDIARITGENAGRINPFTDVLFNFINFLPYTNMEQGLFDGMLEDDDWGAGNITGFDHINTYLDINVNTTADKLVIIYGQRKALLCGKKLSSLQVYFDQAIRAWLADGDTKMGMTALLSSAEYQQLLSLSDYKETTFSPTGSLTARFREQASLTPAAIALKQGQHTLTYEELEVQSNRLGNHLLEQGVVPGSLVLLYMSACPEMIVAILGILKAGAAYVPVDISYPAARIQYIAADTAAGFAVCSSGAGAVPLPGTSVIRIDLFADAAAIDQAPATPPAVDVNADDRAYIIYTSGSTGQPKGVIAHHGAVLNLIADRTVAAGISHTSQIVLASKITFDASVEQMFLALFNGATLHLVTQESLLDKDAFYDLLDREKISYLHATPALLMGLLPLPSLPFLRTVVAGGEACPVTLPALLPPDVVCFNEYGPTETTITTTVYRYEQQHLTTAYLPIGRPVDHVRVYIMDLQGNLLPEGVAGEICIAGAGVSKGYLNKPELTAIKFVPDPLVPGAHMYRSGDKGCWLPDGQLAFLGRMDEQVKIRGYRIEPEEVENVLLGSGLVRQVVVKAEKNRTGQLQLTAYIQPAAGVSKAALEEWLRAQLPEYMIPAGMILMETMPLTHTGKIDRQALTIIHPDLEEGEEQPAGPISYFLVDCWKELLGLQRVGIHQQFTELGGHSLLLLQLLSRIRKAGYTVQLKDLYENNTIASLSERLGQNGVDLQDRDRKHILRLHPHTGNPPLFIMPGSDGISDGYDELAAALQEQFTVYGIQMSGLFEGERPLTSIPAIAAQHIAWIKSVQPEGPYRLAGHSFGAYVACEMVQQLEQHGESIAFTWLLDAPCPFTPEVVLPADRKTIIWNEVVKLLIQYDIITASTPGWLDRIKAAGMQLEPAEMISYIGKALDTYVGEHREQIAFALRLLMLHMVNTAVSYTPHGNIKSPVILVKAAEQRWEVLSPAMGWAAYLPHIIEVSCPGNHFSMVKGKNAGTLAQLLTRQTLFEEKYVE